MKKGILLAGGSGSRLYPSTKVTSKQLLPVYDKPMIYYPLSTLMQFNIRDVLVISTPQDTPNIERLLNDGKDIGMNLSYAVQDVPNGIAQAFIIGEKFVEGDPVCLILGDNIFHMDTQMDAAYDANNATVFGYHVPDPERFGVAEIDDNGRAISIEEKPIKPKSNIAVVGLYLYPGDVVEKTKTLKPSARCEYEITDLNKVYLAEGRLNVAIMPESTAWLDAGTPESLFEATNYVRTIEKNQGRKIACLEEIAYRKGFIAREQLMELAAKYPKDSDYRKYLNKICPQKIY
ncbi:MAG: glucose-1-phosphate thymidylyltransferase RfbA [Alphaproteobacteria bacterium]|nr:glucose-1-phosphate thymidylyltransferase RfbA [Alphaproteobacteria bacterium]